MKNQVEQAFNIIKNGGVILYPTDTVWGLGCDPNNDAALEKINQIKKRDSGKKFIVLVESERLLNRHTKDIPDVCYDLIDYADKPITIIYPKGKNVSKKVLADDGSIAIRVVKHEFCAKLIQRLKHGLISTSANISNQKYPNNFSEIDNEIKNSVDLIIELSNIEQKTKPSQIIKIGEKGEVIIIRK